MKAQLQARYGGPDQLRFGEAPEPLPGRGEVLVRVRAAGVDQGTVHLLHGSPRAVRLAFGLRRPKQPIPGIDLAGVVAAVGEGGTDGADASGLRPGDEVYGTGGGTFAELAVAKVSRVAAKPLSLTFVEAAALPVSGLTALQAVRDLAAVQAGQRVLVVGASGGVGSYTVQVALAAGAHVVGVCSAAKADFVRRLGAQRVVDHAAGPLASLLADDAPFDAIIDVAGRHPLRELRPLLAPRGTLVLAGAEGGGEWFGPIGRQFRAAIANLFTRQRLRPMLSKENAADLEVLARMVAAGEVSPHVHAVYDLPEAAAAIGELMAGRVRGKVVVKVG